jgi:hypothetical protein
MSNRVNHARADAVTGVAVVAAASAAHVRTKQTTRLAMFSSHHRVLHWIQRVKTANPVKNAHATVMVVSAGPVKTVVSAQTVRRSMNSAQRQLLR